MTKPRSRFIPQPRSGLRLTAHDLDLIVDVFLHRVLTRQHLMELGYFVLIAGANSRCRKLYDHRFLVRHFLPLAPFGPAIYGAGTAAVKVITQELNMLESDVRRQLCIDSSPSFIEHALVVADTHIHFLHACRRVGLELDWQSEIEARAEYRVRLPQGWEKRICKPDACIRCAPPAQPGNPLPWFLEQDMGNTSARAWAEKLARYRLFQGEGILSSRYGVNDYRLLIVTTTPVRATHLTELAAREGARQARITTASALAADGPFAPIWIAPEVEGRIGLD